jgi:carbon monoxide dehydrogenase subunit G
VTLGGTFTFAGPRDAVWPLLQDPEVLARALPGTKTLARTAEDRFEGVMKVSIGPVTAAEFAVVVTLQDLTRPSHFAMRIDGKGGVGFVKGTTSIDLAEADTQSTLMTYASDVHIGGRIAAVGQRLVESVARMMTKQALEALDRELAARLKERA